MSDSEDFGIDDDDTEFVAVATQIEAQHDGFEPCQRPTKRRRISDDAIDDEILDRHSTAAGSDEEGYYFPGELERDQEAQKKARLAKYKIYTSKHAQQLPSVFLTQTQVELDEDPAAIRGPIWKKPPKKPPPPLFDQAVQPMGAAARPASNSIANFVQRTSAVHDQRSKVSMVQQQAKPGPSTKAALQSNKENHDISIDLSDFPSDAFSSSIIEDTAQQTTQVDKAQGRAVRGPQNGLKQMTIYGQPATQPLTSTQTAKKKHTWPVATQDAAPTHHKLEAKALERWTYPTNLGTIRDYQYNIVSRSLFHNTLVALPTGLGKTFIAATVMLNYYHWTTNAQIIFMAPTKPLIAQQMEACYGIVGIPRQDTVLMTGETTPAVRAEEWLEKRVFFMTPQTVINDLKTGICDPKKIVLIVVDEAHKATGGYAYTEVAAFLRRFNQSFRVLALTATPGSTVEAVQAVIDHLGIARVELRTEASLDIRQFTHEKHTDTQLFDFSEEQTLIMGHISKAMQPVLDKLTSQNAYWSKDPMALTPFGLQTARGKWAQSDAGRKASMPIKGMINSVFTVLASLAHGLNLLKFHGIGPFFAILRDFQKTLEEDKAKKKYARQIAESDGFTRAMGHMRAWSNNVDFIGHPKMEYLREVIMNHFLDAGEGQAQPRHPARPTRVMIFSSFRDSTDEICRVLKRSEPLVRPHVFVGQSASKSSEGMDQKKQNAVIQDFKSGKYNTLVATSIGEEGLDIGDVDLIICYDASSSPIRMLQRIGRTGRKRVGKVVLLLMRGKEQNDYIKAQDSYAYIQKTIADESRYTYRDDESPRILPKEARPVVDKRIVDIPTENSQPIDLNEKARRRKGKGKAKRPPKKFNMPDGVRTGFVKASKLCSDDDSEEEATTVVQAKEKQKSRAKTKKAAPEPLPEIAAMPFLNDVLLSAAQIKDHERRYTRTTQDDDNTEIQAPDPCSHPELLRDLQKPKYIRHGRFANLIVKTMIGIHELESSAIDRLQKVRQPTKTELHFAARARLADAIPEDDIEYDQSRIQAPLPSLRPGQHKKAKAPTARSIAKQPARTKASKQRAQTYGSDAMEGSDSEPDPTPADMRIATQGIELGSADTSGEDEDEEPDSELEGFIVNSDAPIEMLSSSLPRSQDFDMAEQGRSHNGRRRLQQRKPATLFSSDISAEEEEENNDNDDSMTSLDKDCAAAGSKARNTHRVVDDSESDL